MVSGFRLPPSFTRRGLHVQAGRRPFSQEYDLSHSGTLSPHLVEFLYSAPAQQAVAALRAEELSPAAALATLTRLRRQFPPDEAGAILTLARLRLRGRHKFPNAQGMYFTEEALEQATAWPVALHRAERINRLAPPGPILDLGCGIGGDTLALAQVRRVIAYERDPVRLAFAQANARSVGLAERIEFRSGDWTGDLACGRLPGAAAAFVDPSRRSGERRVFSLNAMQPPLETLLRLQASIPNLAAKVMPGVNDDELPPTCGVQFVSHERVCKEAVLWFGDLAQHDRWASVHSGDEWFELVSGGARPPTGPIAPPFVLYEPDPAVIRAGAFAELCDLLHGYLLDPQIAYVVSDTVRETPFAAPFLVQEVHPFNLNLLNRRLRELEISGVELKNAASPSSRNRSVLACAWPPRARRPLCCSRAWKPDRSCSSHDDHRLSCPYG